MEQYAKDHKTEVFQLPLSGSRAMRPASVTEELGAELAAFQLPLSGSRAMRLRLQRKHYIYNVSKVSIAAEWQPGDAPPRSFSIQYTHNTQVSIAAEWQPGDAPFSQENQGEEDSKPFQLPLSGSRAMRLPGFISTTESLPSKFQLPLSGSRAMRRSSIVHRHWLMKYVSIAAEWQPGDAPPPDAQQCHLYEHDGVSIAAEWQPGDAPPSPSPFMPVVALGFNCR